MPVPRNVIFKFLTEFEIANLLSHRVGQIERDSPVFIDIEDFDSPYLIALKELLERKNPLILNREIETPDGIIVEKFKVREMDIDGFATKIRAMSSDQIKKYLKKLA